MPLFVRIMWECSVRACASEPQAGRARITSHDDGRLVVDDPPDGWGYLVTAKLRGVPLCPWHSKIRQRWADFIEAQPLDKLPIPRASYETARDARERTLATITDRLLAGEDLL